VPRRTAHPDAERARREEVAAGSNKFVHLALARTLQLAAELRGAASVRAALAPGLDIAIVGANDFYSQRAAVRPRCRARSPRPF
jgi:hypothetical protein